MRGFDCNWKLTPAVAAAAKAQGYDFVVRYIGRAMFRIGDLTGEEAAIIHGAGLGISVVQHYEGDGWLPTDDKGRNYGTYMAAEMASVGVPVGVTAWVDVEGIGTVDSEQVIRYVNYWSDCVASIGGYQPGAYWGWHNRLTPAQMYQRTRPTRHWGSYNLNTDQFPAVRGLCMKQHVAGRADLIPGAGGQIDTDTLFADALDGVPTLWMP